MSRAKSKSTKKTTGFFKPTISIPSDLSAWVEKRKNEPQHAGNFSSYVRQLIIADKAFAEAAAK